MMSVPVVTILMLATYIYYDLTIDRQSGHEHCDSQIDALINIKRLEDPEDSLVNESHFIQVVQHFEGHLNILDEKIQSLSAYSLNFLALSFPVYYYTSFMTLSQNFHWLGVFSLLFLALGLLASFGFVNRIVWQDYAGNHKRPILAQLFHARHRRTRAFEFAKLLHILAIGLFADYVLFFMLLDGQFKPAFPE
jgi:hypothetical protein